MGVTVFDRRKPAIRPTTRRPTGGPELGVGISGPIVIFDAGLQEVHAIENEITDAPVEFDLFRTDGVITRPRIVEITGVVSSSHPVSRGGMGDPPVPAGLTLTRASNRLHIEAWRQLVEIIRLRIPVDIVTPVEGYFRYVGISARTVRTARDGRSLTMAARFRELQTAVVDDLADVSGPASLLGGATEDLGAQSLKGAA